jgi:hypothetical protein
MNFIKLISPAGVLVTSALFVSVVFAQDTAVNSITNNPAVTDELLVEYPASFFSRYQPANALDMVRQVPGFQLDDGTSDRGFIAAVGNILINDVYPSAKLDSPSALLTRIPANQVASVELIRGQVRGIDLQGQSVVVNVVLHGDLPAVVRYDLNGRYHSEGPFRPGLDISLSDRWGRVEYNTGLRIEREANGETGLDRFLDANGNVVEDSAVRQKSTGIDSTVTLNASTLLGQTLTQFRTRLHYETRARQEYSSITPLIMGEEPRDRFVGDDLTIKQFEIGVDALRNLNSNLVGKGIFQFFLEGVPRTTSRIITDASGVQTSARIADINAVETEAITRIELDWRGMAKHNFQLNMEGAFNSLEGTLEQTIDTGSGPVVVDVPGSNSLVKEYRGDFLVKDTWALGKFELDYGLGAELSNISQSGDAEQERDFFFLKPHAILTYSSGQGQQTKVRVAREVAQLNFNDFISTTFFEDNELSLGNPNLRPDTTWITELSHERRFGQRTVIKLTGFHHWISNVLDLLPLTPTDEAPGNIGDGRRWGMELEVTMPLGWTGLTGSKLDVVLRWQDSTVVDPVTGENRVLSGQGGANAYRTLATANKNNRYGVRVDYRQDLQASHIAWGWTIAERDKRPLFKVNELDISNEGFAIDVFIETTRWRGLKVRVSGDNLLNFGQKRWRTFFSGLRDLSPVDSYETRVRHNGRRFTLAVSGSF